MEPSRIMPNIYFLGFKTGQALHFLTSSGADGLASQLPSLHVVLEWICDFPTLYGNWWWDLVRKDPIHVLVETTLILSILYILIARSKDWKETEEHLTLKEEEELLLEWKLNGRAPLTPASPSAASVTSNTAASDDHSMVVHKMHGPYMDISIVDTTTGASATTTTTAATTATTVVSNSGRTILGGKRKSLQQQQQQQQALQQQQQQQQHEQVFSVLNFATFDYLGMSYNQPSVRQAADRALNIYGCGSCGPRGFYGTIDAHLQLEQAFAQFLHVDGAILYSDGASACASTIAAFAKRGDLIVCDEGIYEPLRTGVTLSRAHVKWFQHNDMADLRRVLTKIAAHDAKVKRPLNAQRRFLVVEGLYKTTGTICPLAELVKLKHEFSYRLILDESNSFGTLGATGRGLHEHANCRLMHDVEITTIALENSMGAIGGITVGTEEVVEHQRLSGSGYCFSASSPPFTATAAVQALHLLQTTPQTTLQPLHDNVAYFHYKLTQLCHVTLEDFLLVTSAPHSPIVLLQVADIPETRNLDEILFLKEVVQECLQIPSPTASSQQQPPFKAVSNSADSGNAVGAGGSGNSNATTTASTTTPGNNTTSTMAATTTSISTSTKNVLRGGMALVVVHSPPGIRITVSAAHTHEHLDQCLKLLTESVEVVIGRSH